MNYRAAREILAEAAGKSSYNARSRFKATHGNFAKDLASGKETERIINKIEANHADASKRAMDEYALARSIRRTRSSMHTT